jgi:hypothetical protein
MNQLQKVLILVQNKQTQIRNIALGVFAVIIAILLVNTKIVNDREQEYLQQMREFKEQAETATVYADSLKAEVSKYDSASAEAKRLADRAAQQARRSSVKAGQLEDQLDSLKRTISDSVEMARVIIPTQDSIIQQYKVTVQKKDEQILFLGVALEEKNAALIISNQRGDSLQRVVNNIPEPPAPPALPRISRKQAFAGGVALGIIVKSLLFPKL